MSLAYNHENHLFRVDGDVLETFILGGSEQRVLLSWLFVRVFPQGRGRLALSIGSASPDLPLYEALPKATVLPLRGTSMQLNIKIEEEPAIRAFFTQVALLADRRVVP
jgi:hypothetical protein